MPRDENKTQPDPAADVTEYLEAVEDSKRRADGLALNQIFREATGTEPVLWGSSIVGFGNHHYVYKTGREGDTPAVGFSPRKSALVIYGLQNYGDRTKEIEALGPVTFGKGCVYVKDLSKLDAAGLKALAADVYGKRSDQS